MAQRLQIPDTAFKQRKAQRQRQPRTTNEAHCAWIRTLPCLITGRRDRIECAHIRYADSRFAKRETGKGERPDDRWTVPLCRDMHRHQHEFDERSWWKFAQIDATQVALALWNVSGDSEAAEQIIGEARKR